LTVTLPSGPLYLDADPARLTQVFANLLNNAARYTPPGGRITLAAEPASRGREPPEAIVSVRDTGVGLAPETLPTLFEPFTQAGRAPGTTQGGLGLGLSVVRGLVELHGGWVEAHSEGPGKGSEFVVRLPLAEGDAGAPAGAGPGREGTG
jgi:signal transduction histidine kinase